MIGPAAGSDCADRFPLDIVLPLGLDLNAVIVWETPIVLLY